MNHTPAPWYLSDSHFTKGNVILSKVDECGAHVCTMPEFKDTAQDNAAFIVRACNAHDDLVAALEAVLKAADWLNDPPLDTFGAKAHKQARAALKQAKE